MTHDYNLIQGIPNGDIILLPIQWITSGAGTDISLNFKTSSIIYVHTVHIIVYTPAALDNVITDIEGRTILQLGAMTNAVSLDFPILTTSRGARLKWQASAAGSKLSVAYQRILSAKK